ncbi:MAG: DUF2971 domain-containing protein [Spirochaetaceae bacterium]|nr:DUF2971 domain-containing protein [Spirochaetaceae bacterium]
MDNKSTNSSVIGNQHYLYHYTTKEGFIGILKNRCMWASNIYFMDDRSEFKFAFEILNDVIKDHKELCKLEIDIKPNKYKGTEVYSVSFSERFDIISQWDNYTGSAPGYCISFRKNDLNSNFKKGSEKLIKYNGKTRAIKEQYSYQFKLVKCIYDKDEQYKYVHELVNETLTNFDGKVDKIMIQTTIAEKLLEVAPLMKKDIYKEEQEWRCIITKVNDRSKLDARAGKRWPIPFYKLTVDLEKCLRDVYYGNCAEIDLEQVKDATSAICFNCGIEFSLSKNGGIYHVGNII